VSQFPAHLGEFLDGLHRDEESVRAQINVLNPAAPMMLNGIIAARSAVLQSLNDLQWQQITEAEAQQRMGALAEQHQAVLAGVRRQVDAAHQAVLQRVALRREAAKLAAARTRRTLARRHIRPAYSARPRAPQRRGRRGLGRSARSTSSDGDPAGPPDEHAVALITPPRSRGGFFVRRHTKSAAGHNTHGAFANSMPARQGRASSVYLTETDDSAASELRQLLVVRASRFPPRTSAHAHHTRQAA
jgi:hypothetical protein